MSAPTKVATVVEGEPSGDPLGDWVLIEDGDVLGVRTSLEEAVGWAHVRLEGRIRDARRARAWLALAQSRVEQAELAVREWIGGD